MLPCFQIFIFYSLRLRHWIIWIKISAGRIEVIWLMWWVGTAYFKRVKRSIKITADTVRPRANNRHTTPLCICFLLLGNKCTAIKKETGLSPNLTPASRKEPLSSVQLTKKKIWKGRKHLNCSDKSTRQKDDRALKANRKKMKPNSTTNDQWFSSFWIAGMCRGCDAAQGAAQGARFTFTRDALFSSPPAFDEWE